MMRRKTRRRRVVSPAAVKARGKGVRPANPIYVTSELDLQVTADLHGTSGRRDGMRNEERTARSYTSRHRDRDVGRRRQLVHKDEIIGVPAAA
jgi:hypothetical protein